MNPFSLSPAGSSFTSGEWMESRAPLTHYSSSLGSCHLLLWFFPKHACDFPVIYDPDLTQVPISDTKPCLQSWHLDILQQLLPNSVQTRKHDHCTQLYPVLSLAQKTVLQLSGSSRSKLCSSSLTPSVPLLPSRRTLGVLPSLLFFFFLFHFITHFIYLFISLFTRFWGTSSCVTQAGLKLSV